MRLREEDTVWFLKVFFLFFGFFFFFARDESFRDGSTDEDNKNEKRGYVQRRSARPDRKATKIKGTVGYVGEFVSFGFFFFYIFLIYCNV